MPKLFLGVFNSEHDVKIIFYYDMNIEQYTNGGLSSSGGTLPIVLKSKSEARARHKWLWAMLELYSHKSPISTH